MSHIITIVDSRTKCTKFPMATSCAKCHKPLIIPEPYVSWYRRTLSNDISTLYLRCPECGGPQLYEYTHVSKVWAESSVEASSNKVSQKVEPSDNVHKEMPPAVADPTERQTYIPNFYDEDDNRWGLGKYTTRNSFLSALNALKECIVENNNGQHGTVE